MDDFDPFGPYRLFDIFSLCDLFCIDTDQFNQFDLFIVCDRFRLFD